MKTQHVPQIDARYWIGITLASVFGTNTGDLFAFRSGLGILGGIPILAVVAAFVYWLERRDSSDRETWYWLAIILIRTGATNIADFACGRRFLGIDRVVFSTVLAVVIALMAVWQYRRTGSALAQGRPPSTDANYWITMLAAGVFGTAAGDAVLDALGGPEGAGGVLASAILTVILLGVLLAGRGRLMRTIGYYWLTICAARTAGTAIADMLAENQAMNIGLPLSTVITGIAFFAVVMLWQPRQCEGLSKG
ncbi:MAG: hypothetical protein QM696_03390 [Steroidobacteraceae bacterium]